MSDPSDKDHHFIPDPDNPVLKPADPKIIGYLFDIAEMDEYPGTWEDEVNPWDVGLCALHMEYSEPWEYVWIYHKPPTEQQDQKGGKHGTQQAE